jgi:hypothetical protein
MNTKLISQSCSNCPCSVPEQTDEKPAFIQSLLIEEFTVDYDLQVYNNSEDYPTASNKITLKGRPAMGSSEVII